MGDGISEMEVDGFRKLLGGGSLDPILERLADGVTYEDEVVGARTGKDAFSEAWSGWMTAFPDLKVESRHTTIQGNTAVMETTTTGTNTGPLNMAGGALPPTNKKVALEGAWVFGFNSEGKVTNFRVYGNPMKMLQQLGIDPASIPKPPAATSP